MQTLGRGENGRGALAWPVKEKNGRGRKRGHDSDEAPF
jgi:hypothetical protein